MWASAQLVKSSAQVQIVDLTVYDASTGGVGSSWSAMPVFGTSGMAGSIIDHRSIGGEKPV